MAYPTSTADREAHESELIAPTNQFTVSDNFDANTFGEIGLATGDVTWRDGTCDGDLASPRHFS